MYLCTVCVFVFGMCASAFSLVVLAVGCFPTKEKDKERMSIRVTSAAFYYYLYQAVTSCCCSYVTW